MAAPQQGMDVSQLPIPQLQQFKQSMDEEVQYLQTSFSQLKIMTTRFTDAAEALRAMVPANKGKTALVPLSGSMYVQAVLENTDKVLVDIGTGYFVRKTIKEAQEFYKRKIAFLEENCEKIQAVLTQKRMQRDVVIDVLQMRLQAQAAAQSAAGGSAVQASA
eukprot:Opistho-2@50607